MTIEEAIQKLEEMRKKVNEDLTPSQRLLLLSLIEKEMDALNVKLDHMLAELPA